jgi:2-isopropylmalate synthase
MSVCGGQTPQDTPQGDEFHLCDTTLRGEYSAKDRLTVAKRLDDLGVGFIEGGKAPEATEFFRRAGSGELELRHAALVAYATMDDDPRTVLDSGAQVVTLAVDSRHEDVQAIGDTVRVLTAEGRRVFLAAEHFFDVYGRDPKIVLRVLAAGVEAGADLAVLCDTSGGQLPGWLGEIVQEVLYRTGYRIGIRCHDSTGCAVANTITAVQAGATHVQTGPGVADLATVVANLVSKLDLPVLPPKPETRRTDSREVIIVGGW